MIMCVLLIATLGGPTMLARIGVMRALNRKLNGCLMQLAKSIIGGAAS